MYNIISEITRGDIRSVKAKKNIVASTLIKGADTLVYLLLVPLTLGYLNPFEYGIWLTLNSILVWVNAFDIGLGSGLRNKLGESIAQNNKEKARSYVSTTFYMLILITIALFTVGYVAISWVDWYELLNVEVESVKNIESIVKISFFFFCVNFIFKFVGNVYQALQLPAVNSFIAFSSHLLSLIVIWVLTKTTSGSLFLVAFVYSIAPPLVYLLCYPITFYRLYPYLAPSLKFFRTTLLKDLLSLGFLFFIFQIMGIVLFSLSNILISNMFGPEQVTPYNIAYRYFSILLMVSNLLMAPVWAAATDAYSKGEIDWIKRCLRKLKVILFISSLVILIMVLIATHIYRIWVGNQVQIPITLSFFMGVYIFILLWSLCFSSILNGMSKLKVQAINIIFEAIAFYPVCWLFAEKYGVIGVVIGMAIVNLPGAILNTIQLNKILDKSATGIWNK